MGPVPGASEHGERSAFIRPRTWVRSGMGVPSRLVTKTLLLGQRCCATMANRTGTSTQYLDSTAALTSCKRLCCRYACESSMISPGAVGRLLAHIARDCKIRKSAFSRLPEVRLVTSITYLLCAVMNVTGLQ